MHVGTHRNEMSLNTDGSREMFWENLEQSIVCQDGPHGSTQKAAGILSQLVQDQVPNCLPKELTTVNKRRVVPMGIQWP